MITDDEEERNLRRVSYLRATKEDRMHIDSDAEESEQAGHVTVPNTPKHRLVYYHSVVFLRFCGQAFILIF